MWQGLLPLSYPHEVRSMLLRRYSVHVVEDGNHMRPILRQKHREDKSIFFDDETILNARLQEQWNLQEDKMT